MKKLLCCLLVLISQVCSAKPITLTFDFLEHIPSGSQGHLILKGEVDLSGDHPIFTQVDQGYFQSFGKNYLFGATHFRYQSLVGNEWGAGYGIMHVNGTYLDSDGFEQMILAYCEGFEERLIKAGLLDAEGYFQIGDAGDYLPAKLRLHVDEPASYLLGLLGLLCLAVRRYNR